MKRRIILAAPVLLAGCASLLPAQKYTPRTDWPLSPVPPAGGPANAQSGTPGKEAGKVVLLRDLTAGPGMDEQGIQTLNGDGSLDVSYYNRWAVAPADAASEALGAWLTASGAFSAVVSPGSRLTADLIVEGELTELLSDVAANQAVAVLTLVVIRNLSGNTRPLAQQRITGVAPLGGSGSAADVRAQSAALADALGQAVALVTRFG